jgi:hypothetical protein
MFENRYRIAVARTPLLESSATEEHLVAQLL